MNTETQDAIETCNAKLLRWLENNHDILTRSEFNLRADVVIAGLHESYRKNVGVDAVALASAMYSLLTEFKAAIGYDNNTI